VSSNTSQHTDSEYVGVSSVVIRTVPEIDRRRPWARRKLGLRFPAHADVRAHRPAELQVPGHEIRVEVREEDMADFET
jgi:hypothetical protein